MDAPSLANYFYVGEVAQILQVRPATVRRWEKAGKLIPVRHPISRFRLYHKSEVEQLIERAHRCNKACIEHVKRVDRLNETLRSHMYTREGERKLPK